MASLPELPNFMQYYNRRHVHVVHTSSTQCADDMRARLRWRFRLADDICHPERCPHIVHRWVCCLHDIRRHVCHPHVICRHICHPHIICRIPHGQHGPELSFYCNTNWLLNGICHNNVELFHFRIM